MPEYIDIHSHVHFEAFNTDRNAVIQRALNTKTWIINVGTQKDTSKSAMELAHKYENGVYAIVGLHPIHTGASYFDEQELGDEHKQFTESGEVFDYEFYKKLLQDPKVVALGECGLDYFRLTPETREKQKAVFLEHIKLANEVGKPLMLHIRNSPNKEDPSAYDDAYELLREHSKVSGNVHFFAGSWEEAVKFLELGFTLSFTGVITFARNYDEVIQKIPLDRILSETDCPYVAPVPYRGKRNEPVYVSEVVKKIAEVREEDLETVKKAIVSNAFKLFKFKSL